MIRTISFPSDLTRKVGLREATMSGLGSVVVLAGPNGSGKSRLLQILPAVLKDGVQHESNLQKLRRQIERLRDQLRQEGAKKRLRSEQIEDLERLISEKSRDADRAARRKFSVSNERLKPIALSFAHVGTNFDDADRVSPFDARVALDKIRRGRAAPADFYKAIHIFLQYVSDSISNRSHAELAALPDTVRNAEDAELFNALIHQLLGTSVTIDIATGRARPHLYGRPIKPDELSAGQKLCLAWGICLHSNEVTSLKDQVVLVDEPENHLHPAACLEVLDRLAAAVGQLWIATHSPAVVAHFGPGALFSMDGGLVQFAGTRISNVMEGLLGGAEGRARLGDFMAGAEQFAILKFAAESLLSPQVAGYREDDAQLSQLSALIADRQRLGAPIRILDYSAGRGRLAGALAEPRQQPVSVDYRALVESGHDEHRQECARNIEKLSPGESDRRIHGLANDFADPGKRVDVVVLCNVLHEVPPIDWAGLLANCAACLRDDGVLLVLEDREPPIGELPHEGGFMILNADEMRTLVGAGPEVCARETQEPRLSMIEVPRQALTNVSTESLSSTLRALQQRTLQEILAVRTEPSLPDHRRGRRHALLAMQHVNASLTLRALKEAGTPEP